MNNKSKIYKDKINVIIMGAAGRDFHNFNTYFRDNPYYDVVAFTATQIPNISGRKYPWQLAGKLYPKGILIYLETELNSLIKKLKVDYCYLSYSDLSYNYVMHKASEVIAAGSNFSLLGFHQTSLISNKQIISVCAVRTGAGKSSTTQKLSKFLKNKGLKVVVVRHPMPYGDLLKQTVQRFETYEDLKKHDCTIEEREEYEPHIKNGLVVYAGVDYERVLRAAEKEADIIIWDGGNNDLPFFKPDIHIVVVDPHRAGDEISYYPGEINLRLAHIIIVNKVNTATKRDILTVLENIKKYNPKALVIQAALKIIVDKPELLKDKKVLVVEDGPTLTHGGMTYGAGTIAAREHGVKQIVDPRRYVVGEIKKTFRDYPHIGKLLPAMGYSARQRKDLEKTINSVPCDVVIDATPIDLEKLVKIKKRIVTVDYVLDEIGTSLGEVVFQKLKKKSNFKKI